MELEHDALANSFAIKVTKWKALMPEVVMHVFTDMIGTYTCIFIKAAHPFQ